MFILIIWLVGPVVQIILSSLRIKKRIKLPIIGSTVLAWVLGIALSIAALPYLVPPPPPSNMGGRCGMPEVAIVFGGIFIDGIAAFIIGVISYIAYRIKQKDNRKPQPIVFVWNFKELNEFIEC